ncbi:MAG: hypothetical protein R6U27_15655, partial [Desulfobacterales bacterium]
MRQKTRKRTLLSARLMLVVLVGSSVFACQSTPARKTLPEPAFTPSNEIRLSPGDSIELKFPYTEEFNET